MMTQVATSGSGCRIFGASAGKIVLGWASKARAKSKAAKLTVKATGHVAVAATSGGVLAGHGGASADGNASDRYCLDEGDSIVENIDSVDGGGGLPGLADTLPLPITSKVAPSLADARLPVPDGKPSPRTSNAIAAP